MASNHLVTLKAMCLNADILGKVEQREALGWALARLNELTGTKIAEALSGKRNDEMIAEMQTMQDTIEQLNEFVNYVCAYNRIDRRRMENQHKWKQSLSGR